jgi:hypothetical protein
VWPLRPDLAPFLLLVEFSGFLSLADLCFRWGQPTGEHLRAAVWSATAPDSYSQRDAQLTFLDSIAGRDSCGQWRVVVAVLVLCARRDHDDGSWDRKTECARSGSAARGQATRRTRKHRGNLATLDRESRQYGLASLPPQSAETDAPRRHYAGQLTEPSPPAILRACAVPNDGEKQRRSPRALPRACAGRGCKLRF